VCGKRRRHKGNSPRIILTAAGHVTLSRVYFTCDACLTGEYALDTRLGITEFVSPQARRLLALAAASWSFAGAEKHLQQFCGLSVSESKIRDVAQREGQQIAEWQRTANEAQQPFREATGDVEFQTDGTSVNTWEGWREMKIGLFLKRERGAAAAPDEWDTRSLPAPHARLAFAAIEKCDRFCSRWGRWMKRLGIDDPSEVSVLADGARWIWDRVESVFPGSAGVLDIYHGSEHIAATAKTLYGEGSPQAGEWTDAGRAALLHGGWGHLNLQITATETEASLTVAAQRSLKDLVGYFANQSSHLNYKQRLAEGRSIGSGAVEGAAKNLIGRRLKQTGARWRVRRVNRMATLCSAFYSDHWDAYWNFVQN
jgi:hypothetical protein